jgi:hypothetical protein
MLNHERLANANRSPIFLTYMGIGSIKDASTSLSFYYAPSRWLNFH